MLDFFPQKTKIAVGLLFIPVGLIFSSVFLVIINFLGIGRPGESEFLSGIVATLFFIIVGTPFFLFPLYFLLLRRKWAWWAAIIWLAFGVLIWVRLWLTLLTTYNFSLTALDFDATDPLHWCLGISGVVFFSSFLLLVLDKKNFEKIIIPEKKKISHLILLILLPIVLYLIIIGFFKGFIQFLVFFF